MSDVRAGGLPKDAKLCSTLVNKHGQDVEDKSLTICSGTDYININYQHIVCPDADTAKVPKYNNLDSLEVSILLNIQNLIITNQFD